VNLLLKKLQAELFQEQSLTFVGDVVVDFVDDQSCFL
jgi:hypothetical protein